MRATNSAAISMTRMPEELFEEQRWRHILLMALERWPDISLVRLVEFYHGRLPETVIDANILQLRKMMVHYQHSTAPKLQSQLQSVRAALDHLLTPLA